MKPPFRWAGGKRRLIDYLAPLLQDIKGRYVEPFCGSAAIFFALERDGESLLNDISQSIVKTFKGLKQSSSTSKYFAELQKRQSEYGARAFYQYLVKEVTNTSGNATRYAAYFIATNQTSFNGLWRVNKSGQYNVPIGYRTVNGQKTPYELKTIDFAGYARALKNVEITRKDFRELTLKKGDRAYCDPPYLDQFSAYAEEGFTKADHLDLKEWCTAQAAKGAGVVLSGAGNEETLAVYGRPTIVINRACTIGASNRKRTDEYIYAWGDIDAKRIREVQQAAQHKNSVGAAQRLTVNT